MDYEYHVANKNQARHGQNNVVLLMNEKQHHIKKVLSVC
jgi:hypothetical protein